MVVRVLSHLSYGKRNVPFKYTRTYLAFKKIGFLGFISVSIDCHHQISNIWRNLRKSLKDTDFFS